MSPAVARARWHTRLMMMSVWRGRARRARTAFRLGTWTFAACLAACVGTRSGDVGIDDNEAAGYTGVAADGAGIAERSREARAVLRVANEVSLEALRTDAHVSSRAARAIVAHRAGADSREGTSDDDAFDSLAELDGVRYVGASVLRALLAFARANGLLEEALDADVQLDASAAEEDAAESDAARGAPDAGPMDEVPTAPPEGVVDARGWVGRMSSIAADEHGDVVIAYNDESSGDVKLARLHGTTTTVDIVARGAITSTRALAIDAHGAPHIAYRDSSTLVLRHASWNGSAWDDELVSRDSSDEADWAAIALDSRGEPQIAFYQGGGLTALMYAVRSAGRWHVESVDFGSDFRIPCGRHSSMVLDASDHAHIAYDDGGTVKYATWTGTRWSIEPLATLDVDRTAIALDRAGEPVIVTSGVGGLMELARSSGSTTWSIRAISDELAPRDVSLTIDHEGHAWIAYLGTNGLALRVAAKMDAAWTIRTLHEASSLAAFGSTSIAVDRWGRAHVSYHDAIDRNLMYVFASLGPAP